jgi:hypothetical protein
MDTRRFLVSVSASIVLAGLCAPALAQGSAPRRLSGEQKLQVEALFELVDAVVAQKRSAPADVALRWQNDFLKADKGLVYVPYTIGIDGKFATLPVAMYVRVLRKDAQQAYYDGSRSSTMRTWLNIMSSPTQIDTKDIRSGNVAGTGLAAEDVSFFEPPKDGRLTRALWLPPGDYDVFVAMRERPTKGLPKVVVLKQPLTVPDLSKALAISSLIVADSVEPTSRALNDEQQASQPYTIGGTKITPAVTTRFRNTAELMVVFFVYNPTPGADGKPDIQVDYAFMQKTGEVERIFTASPEQLFNARTLPPEFNVALGHQLMAGQSVPLDSFPPGQYRLQVTVTDNLNHATATGDLSFSVLGQ